MRLRPTSVASLFVFAASAVGACATQQETGNGAGGGATSEVGGGTGRAVNTSTSTTSAGGATATTSGTTSETGSEGGGGSSSSSSSGSPGCAHDPCIQGAALDASCDACVASVCASDGFCCTDTWDDVCVAEVGTVCGGDCGGGGGGAGSLGAGDLVITEIMNNPKAVTDAAGEWFELHNTTAGTVDLDGLVIRHDGADPAAVHTIAGPVVVPAGGYVVLGVNGDLATNGGVDVSYVYPAAVSLGNGADYLAIETADAQPVVIDETSWDEASGFDPDGASRSLDPAFSNAAANDDDAHFCAATSPLGGAGSDKGTPGAANDACN